MPTFHRLKHNFTAGEISPLTSLLVDFSRFKNGCLTMKNMVSIAQGPATRRTGFEFIYNLSELADIDNETSLFRLIPFIYNEDDAYVLVLYTDDVGDAYCVFARNGGLVVYPDPAPTACPTGTPITVNAGDIVTVPLTGFDIETLDYAQSGDQLFIAQTGLTPHVITRYDHHCWTLSSITFTGAPTDWSTVNGWPERVTFHQQRLLFGCNTLRPQTIWCSAAGDFLVFTAGTADDSAFVFTLDSGSQNKIQWIKSRKVLNIGTLGGEWVVTGATTQAITPTNLLADRQTKFGSERVRPLLINFATLFVEKHGRNINEFVYDYQFDSFKVVDLSVLAPHLTDDYSIINWAYQKVPYGIVWASLEDGTALGLTYQRQHKIVGWHRHDTQGLFKDFAVIPSKSWREDELWAVVKRANGFMLERKAPEFKGTTSIEGKFLDCYAVYNSAPTTTVSGLDHLENQTVSILADGAAHPDKVVSGGSITLDRESSYVVVGLSYTSELKPVLNEINLEDGTTVGRTQQIIGIDVTFHKTMNCYVGTEFQQDGETDEEEVPFRLLNDNLGEPVPLFSGNYEIDLPEGYDETVRYFIRQSKPFPLTILGIVDIVQVNN